MRALFFVLFFVQSTFALAAGSGHPTSLNCNLAAPPASAGEEMNHGITLRIYPRARDIDAKYSGCQTMWMPNGKQWTVVSRVAIELGDPIRIWSPQETDPTRMGCVYKNGKVVKGNAENCAAPEFLIYKSLAPGCVEKIRKAVAAGGLGAPRAPSCDYE